MIKLCLLLLLVLAGLGDTQMFRPDEPLDPRMEGVSPDTRSRLTAEQLAVYFPEQVGPFQPVTDSFRGEEIEDLEDDRHVISIAAVDYKSTYNTSRGSGSFDVRIRVDDWIDWPTWADDMSAGIDLMGEGSTEQWDGMLTQTRLDDGTLVIDRVKVGDFGEVKREVLIGRRFKVTMTAKPSPDFDLDALQNLLAETYESSRLPQLADAPVYAEADPVAGLPGWLGGESNEAIKATIACDELLPVAEIERVCGVSGVRGIDTGMASEGECSRMFKRGNAISGFVFLLSRHGEAETARRALSVAADTDAETEPRRLPELADGGFGFENGAGEARVAFTAGDALVELKSSDGPLDGDDEKLCLQPDQVEQIAQGVARHLSD
jgi:hypothetical protein